jgi:hypothetical protein
MSKNKIIAKKVDLEMLIETLTDLWDKGVDYVDLSTGEDGAHLSIHFSKDYLSTDLKDNVEEEEPPTDISDLDLNDLI